MTQHKVREPYYDNLKGLLIILVCAGHCLNLYRDSNQYCNYLFHLIYAFHMPLFFFISGYFSKNIEKVYKGAFEALIIPTIPFELLYYIAHIVSQSENTKPFFTPIFAYWFCFVLFFCRLLLPYLTEVRCIVIITFAVALVAGFNPYIDEHMSLSRLLCMLPFFLLGYFTSKKMMDRIRRINPGLTIMMGIGAAIAILLLLRYVDADLGFTLRSPYERPEGVLLRAAQFALAAPLSLMVITLTSTKKSYMSIIGQRTLQIYYLHFYIITMIKMINPLIESSTINCIIMVAIAPVIAAILASDTISKGYNAIVNVTGRLIMK